MSTAASLAAVLAIDASRMEGRPWAGDGGPVDQQPRRLELDDHVGEHALQTLELGQLAAKLDPLLVIGHCRVEGRLGNARRDRWIARHPLAAHDAEHAPKFARRD